MDANHADGEVLTVATPIHSPTDLSVPNLNRPKRIRKKDKYPIARGWLAATKRWSWRLTAIWCWLHFFMWIFAGRDRFLKLENRAIFDIELGLSHIGFSPTNKAVFPVLLKVGWLALISGFSALQITWFFLVYLPSFPLTVVILVFFGKKWRDQLEKNRAKTGLSQSRPKSRKFTIATIALLAAWILLYAGSNGRLPQMAGMVFAGILLIERFSAALSFAGPIEPVKSNLAEAFAETTSKLLHKDGEGGTPANSSKDEIPSTVILGLQKWVYFLLRKAAWFTRGSKGRSRAAMIVLLRYLLNLFVLGCATVIFWALAIRLNVSGSALGLTQAVLASAARVLPGLTVPGGLHLPLWVEAGSSVSAWVLFVVYTGPAASIFPLVQQAYVNAMSEAHIKFRRAAIFLLLHIREAEIKRTQKDQSTS